MTADIFQHSISWHILWKKWVASLNFLALSAKRRTSAETLTEMPGNKTGAVAAARAEGEALTIGHWNWTSKKKFTKQHVLPV